MKKEAKLYMSDELKDLFMNLEDHPAPFEEEKEDEEMDEGFEPEEISISVKTHFSPYDEDSITWEIDILNHFTAQGDRIGQITCELLDTKQTNPLEIRANADFDTFFSYQTISAFRIYRTHEEALNDAEEGYPLDKVYSWEPTPTNTHQPEYDRGCFEKKRYRKGTIGIWGKILIIDQFSLKSSYLGYGVEDAAIRLIQEYAKRIGIDWIIVNPNLQDSYLEKFRYPSKNSTEYANLFKKHGFQGSKGRTTVEVLAFQVRNQEASNR